MQILYPATAHPLLGLKAKDLLAKNPQGFDVHNAMAEVLLNLNENPFTGDEADVALIAVTIQINFQLEQGMDPYLAYNQNSGGNGTRGTTFRGYKGPPEVHGQAFRLAESLLRGSQVVLTSARTRD